MNDDRPPLRRSGDAARARLRHQIGVELLAADDVDRPRQRDLRVQQGLCEQFHVRSCAAVTIGPGWSRCSRGPGCRAELVALASVESGFSARVRSSAGALGIWQFTRSTGREFLKITRYRDDRLDPVRSTQAAAELLQSNYQALGSWPLAITAYNYGTAGMERAASEFGSDYVKIVQNYNGEHFGFAVKNYYAEFLAADQVYRYQDKYFPGIESEEAPPPPSSSPIPCGASSTTSVFTIITAT